MKIYKQVMTYGAVALCAIVLTVGAAGCNTTEGVGEDIGELGDGINDAAD